MFAISKIVRSNLLWLMLILIVATLLRIHDIGALSFWCDEFIAVRNSSGANYRPMSWDIYTTFDDLHTAEQNGPWYGAWLSFHGDVHPPLYFTALGIWRVMFGPGDVTMRNLSLVFSVIGIILLYVLAKRLFDVRTALWACAIMAVASPQIRYGQETRGYSMLVMLALSAGIIAVGMIKNGITPWRLICYAVLMVTIVLTHYFGVAICAALSLYLLARSTNKARLYIAGSLILTIALFLVFYGPHLRGQLRNNMRSGDFLKEANYAAMNTADRVGILPIRHLAEPGQQQWYKYLIAVIYVIPLLFAWKDRALWLPILWIYTTLGLVIALEVGRHTNAIEYIRYTLVIGPMFYLIIAYLGMRVRFGWGIPVVAILYCLTSLSPGYGRSFNPDWRGFAAELDSHIGEKDAFIYGQGQSWMVPHLYTDLSHYSGNLHKPSAMLSTVPSKALISQLSRHERLWIVTISGTDPKDIITRFPEYRVVLSIREPFVASAILIAR